MEDVFQLGVFICTERDVADTMWEGSVYTRRGCPRAFCDEFFQPGASPERSGAAGGDREGFEREGGGEEVAEDLGRGFACEFEGPERGCAG